MRVVSASYKASYPIRFPTALNATLAWVLPSSEREAIFISKIVIDVKQKQLYTTTTTSTEFENRASCSKSTNKQAVQLQMPLLYRNLN